MYAESLLQAGRHFASCCMRLSGTILSVLQYFSGSCVNAVGGVKSYYVSVRYNTFECCFFFLGCLEIPGYCLPHASIKCHLQRGL